MPTHSTTPMPPPGARHAAPNHDRVTRLLGTSWAVLNVAAACVLGAAVHQAEAGQLAAPAAAAPDQPIG